MFSDYNKIADYFENLNNNGGFSYDRIRDLKKDGTLTNDFIEKGLDNSFKNIVSSFARKLNDKSLDSNPYYKKVLLYKEPLLHVFNDFAYLLSCYMNKNSIITHENNNAFIRFPLFFKCACIIYDIEPFNKMNHGDYLKLIDKYIDIELLCNPNGRKDRCNCSYEERIKKYSTVDYSKYVKLDKWKEDNNKNKYFILDEEEAKRIMSAHGEDDVYSFIKNNSSYDSTWVAKNIGDIFGFDIISVDIEKYLDFLIEVKTSFYHDSFTLTENEYNVMKSTKYLDNTSYNIIKLRYDRNTMKIIGKNVYEYNKREDKIIDINDPNVICSIEKIMNSEGNPEWKCTPTVYKKQLKM